MRNLCLFTISLLIFAGCTSKQEKMKKELTDFIRKHDSVLIPLYKKTTLASWNAAISGKPEDFKKSEDLNVKMMEIGRAHV